MNKRTSQDIRRRNRFEVLRRIYAGPGTMSRQDIATATGLSFATVANLTAELLEARVLTEAGHEGSSGGRPRSRLTINAEHGTLIGIDVAETSLQAELFDLSLNVRHTVARDLPTGAVEPTDVVELIAAAVEELLAVTEVQAARVLGVGVSVPGMVRREGGVSAFSPYWSWHDVPMRALLEQRLGMSLHLDNPLKASTVAEMWFGAGQAVDNLVVVTLRAGVGVGVAIDGSLYRGTSNSAGEWGHTCLVPDGRPCTCGNQGCVEAYVSTRGIAETWAEVRELTPGATDATAARETMGGSRRRAAATGGTTLDAVADAADRADATALEAIARTGRYLGVAVANLVNLFNPQVLVLGNEVVDRLGERLLRETRESVARHALPVPLRELRLCRSALPYNTVSRGAATFALEGFLDDREVFGPVSRVRQARSGGRR